MYNHYYFERAARKRRTKAVVLTILFHMFLIGGLAYLSAGPGWQEQLPAVVQEWFGLEPAEQASAPAAEVPQP